MYKKILTSLIAIAILARFIGLSLTPAHLSNDEIGVAYDAYSISKTLRDEHNQFLPITFLSHGIYRSALAVYLTIPSIMIFGNSDTSARIPSAVLGSFTIILLGLFVFEITKNTRLALLSSLILAFSPWHFSASRSAMESNYALFFISLGIYLFFYGLNRQKNWAILASFTSLALSIYGYYTQWGLTPLLIFSLLFLYRKTILKRKIYYLALFLFIFLLTPLLADFTNHLASSRATSDLIVFEPSIVNALSEDHFGLFQKGQIVLKAILDKYSGYINLSYLFFFGSHLLPDNNLYGVGIFFAPLLIFFIVGLLNIKNIFKKDSTFIYSWLIISPLVPAMSRGDTSSVRALPMVLPLSIIIAAGTLILWNYLQRNILRIAAILTLAISLFYFSLIYFFYYPIYRAEDFQYGFEQMAFYIKDHYMEYEKIIVDPRFGNKPFYFYGVPHLYIPYYTYMDPKSVQISYRTSQKIIFDKYEVRHINWHKENLQKNYLYVVPSDNIPDPDQALKQVYEIELPNHKIEFRLYSL